jgi:hypothetical protein
MGQERIVRYFEGIDQSAYKELKYANAEGLKIVSSHPGAGLWWEDKSPTFREARDYAVYLDICHRLVDTSGPGGDYYVECSPCNGCGTNLANKEHFSLNVNKFNNRGRICDGPSWTLCAECFEKMKKIIHNTEA